MQNPESALKRADELIAVGQSNSALQLLLDTLLNRRSRYSGQEVLEPIALKFIDLSVELNKVKLAREALHQYKNLFQNTSIPTIEKVMSHFITSAQQKVSSELKTNLEAAKEIEDLEAIDTPESILQRSIAAEEKEKNRNNTRLEALYHSVSSQAFNFCVEYSRKAELRRLCEIQRQYLSNAVKYAGQQNSIDLGDPETIQRLLDTRFHQLYAVSGLELWQEAFKSVEDIHHLFLVTQKPPKPQMMANYYEKLAKIFLVGENYLFHAAAFSKFASVGRTNPNLTEAEHAKLATLAVVSALSIPVTQSESSVNSLESEEQKQRSSRLAGLLQVQKVPSRQVLIRDALVPSCFSRVPAEVARLYEVLEKDFDPLTAAASIGPCLVYLEKDSELCKYVKPLRNVLFTKITLSLSKLYSSVKLPHLFKFYTLPAPFAITEWELERFLLQNSSLGFFSVRINQVSETVTFLSQADNEKGQLAVLAKRLHVIRTIVAPPSAEEKKMLFKKAIDAAEEERQRTVELRALIEKKKEEREQAMQTKEQETHRSVLSKLQQEQEQERKRLEEEQSKREADRQKAQRDEIERIETRKMADSILEEFKGKGKVEASELYEMSVEQLRALQLRLAEEDKKEKAQRLKAVFKKVDYLERAMRLEEAPLLKLDFERQKKADLAKYEENKKATLERSKKEHQRALALKSRLARMFDDYKSFKTVLDAEEAELRAKREAEEAARLEQLRKEEEELKKKREAEMEQRKLAEDKKRQEFQKMEEARLKEDEARRAAEEAAAPSETSSQAGSEGVWTRGAKPQADGVYRRPGAAAPPASEPAPSGVYRRPGAVPPSAAAAPSTGGVYKRPGAAESTPSDGVFRRNESAPSDGVYRRSGGATPPSTSSPSDGVWTRGRQPPLAKSASSAGTVPQNEEKKPSGYVPPHLRKTASATGTRRGGAPW